MKKASYYLFFIIALAIALRTCSNLALSKEYKIVGYAGFAVIIAGLFVLLYTSVKRLK